MGTTWILVADASRAQLYAHEKTGSGLNLIQEFVHAESRMKASEIASDRAGHQQSKGIGHGALVERTDPKKYEAERFAVELAQAIEKGRTKNAFEQLVLSAPAQFCGLLNQHLSSNTRDLISANIDKDYTQLPQKELIARLSEHVRL